MSDKEPFAKRIQNIMGQSVPAFIPRGKWQGKTYRHILADIKTNFIDGDCPIFCSVKGDLTGAEIKYHQGASHMNSSQVACISYFKKFFENPQYEEFLLNILREVGISIDESDEIESAAFEYEPSSEERTNFDFLWF